MQGKGRERERREGTRDGRREGGEREKDSLQIKLSRRDLSKIKAQLLIMSLVLMRPYIH